MRKIRPSLFLQFAYISLWTVCLSCLTLLDCGVLCEGPTVDFPQQSKGCDFGHVLQYVVTVPPHSTNREQLRS